MESAELNYTQLFDLLVAFRYLKTAIDEESRGHLEGTNYWLELAERTERRVYED